MGLFRLGHAAFCIYAIASLLFGCSGSQLPTPGSGASAVYAGARRATQSPLRHLIVVVQQGRTFNDLFATYPGADSQTYGCAEGSSLGPATTGSGCPSGDKSVPLKQVALGSKACGDFAGGLSYFSKAYDGGAMDGWNQLDPNDPLCPYTRVRGSDTRPYWRLAKRFALADHAFASTHYGTFVNMLYTIAGTTQLSASKYVAGPPDNVPWGCDAPPGTPTTLLVKGHVRFNRGPFPCFTQFATMADLFDRAGISWRYYFDKTGAGGGNFNPFTAIKDVAEGSDWTNDMSSPATNVFSDIGKGKLADASWVLSPAEDSDAPGTHRGPAWVAALAHAVQKSPYWNDTAIVVIWADDAAGRYYDNVAPPQLDPMGLGFRVPMLVVSKYAKNGYVSHTQYEYGSILKFMEETFGLPTLGGFATDQRANSISDMFTFTR